MATKCAMWPSYIAAIVSIIVLNVLFGFWFAVAGRVEPSSTPPPCAEYAPGTSIPLIRVLFNSPDTDTFGNVVLGTLVWLPFWVSILMVFLTLAIIRQRRINLLNLPPVTPPPPDPVFIRDAAGPAVALLVVAMWWGATSSSFSGWLLLLIVPLLLLRILMSKIQAARVLILTLVFMTASVATSCTSHRLYTQYHGYAPVSFCSQQEEERLFKQLQTQLMAAPGMTAPDIFDRIDHTQLLNDWRRGTSIFTHNAIATKVSVITGLFYVLMCPPLFTWLKDEWDICFRPGFLIAYGLGIYLAIGATFGMVYFNDVLSAAGRQNILCIFATGTTVSDAEFEKLRDDFRRFGWSPQLQQAVQAARAKASRSSELWNAALAHRWSNQVIAQLQPDSMRNDRGNLQPQDRLVDAQTLSDMFYFSFASFTTTGYGDIRPVSDTARFWAILENIAELIFTSIFFVFIFKATDK